MTLARKLKNALIGGAYQVSLPQTFPPLQKLNCYHRTGIATIARAVQSCTYVLCCMPGASEIAGASNLHIYVILYGFSLYVSRKDLGMLDARSNMLVDVQLL